jgi:hypothetical protein
MTEYLFFLLIFSSSIIFETFSKSKICPVTFETCVSEIIFTFSSILLFKSSKSTSKLSVTLTYSISIPISSFKISQGTTFE